MNDKEKLRVHLKIEKWQVSNFVHFVFSHQYMCFAYVHIGFWCIVVLSVHHFPCAGSSGEMCTLSVIWFEQFASLQVFGGSWGSTLALVYAQSHTERVR